MAARQLPYRLGPSPIHGQGVFATKLIPAGTLLPLPRMELDWELFSASEKGFTGFNHSCNNNLGSRDKEQDGRQVLRDIQEGEEITVDYGLPAGYLKHCNCEKCRE